MRAEERASLKGTYQERGLLFDPYLFWFQPSGSISDLELDSSFKAESEKKILSLTLDVQKELCKINKLWTRERARPAAARRILRGRGRDGGEQFGAGPGVRFRCASCTATTRLLLSPSISKGFGVLRMGITADTGDPLAPTQPLLRSAATAPFRALTPGLLPSPPPAPPGKPAAALGSAPSGRTHPHTHAPSAPTRAVTLPDAAHTAAGPRRAGSGRLRSVLGGRCWGQNDLSEDAAERGASPPSVHQSPDTSEIRLWVCGERNATQTPFFRSPRK
ncbi:uncharacterized protein LOC141580467 [Saimiri boliviensis]|uniref:uncharacterized protein LOC141580467 n=1 Tax=Saimiri boliviensis TaxID=27679 RepID=UPI003D7719DC